MNIVLDLDGTLIYAEEEPSKCKTRPYLKEFLQYCFMNFSRVSIWTASSHDRYLKIKELYLSPILKTIGMDFDVEWTKKRCSYRFSTSGYYGFSSKCVITKRLKKLYKRFPYTKHNTIIVDDTPETFSKNYGNGIYIPSYSSYNKGDNLLLLLSNFLEEVIEHYNRHKSIRHMEKRIWFNKKI